MAEAPDRSKSKDLEYSPEQVAAILDAAAGRPDRHHALLYMMIALSTLGRSEAILELDADRQIKKNLIYFNPPDRIQTRKRRAIVPIAPTLAPWLVGLKGRVIRYRTPYSDEARRNGAPAFFERDVADIGRAFEACLIAARAVHPPLEFRVHARHEGGKLIWLPPRQKFGETGCRPKWKGGAARRTLSATPPTPI